MTWAELSEGLNSQKTPHTSPSQASYGVSFWGISEKINCIITAPHYIFPLNVCHKNTFEMQSAFQAAAMFRSHCFKRLYPWLQQCLSSGAVWSWYITDLMPSIEQGTSDSMSHVPRDLAIEPLDDRAPLEKVIGSGKPGPSYQPESKWF